MVGGVMLGLLERLDRDISQSRLPRELPYLQAERAILLARLGQFSRAKDDLAAARSVPDARTVAALTAWIWLADGLIDYFESTNPRARDKVQKARAVAEGGRAAHVLALASAWCAHLDHLSGDFDAMARSLQLALQQAGADHHAALSRTCLTIATVHHGCDAEAQATPWYTRARSHATAQGDGATLSSIMFNMATLRIVAVRLADFAGTPDRALARRALLGAEASTHLDKAVQAKALGTLTWMQRAQALCVLDAYPEALELYDRHFDEAIAEGHARDEAQMLADRAWCLFKTNRSDDARVLARSASAALVWATEADSQTIAHGQLARTYEALGLHEDAKRHAEGLLGAQAAHAAIVARKRAALAHCDFDALYRSRVTPAPQP